MRKDPELPTAAASSAATGRQAAIDCFERGDYADAARRLVSLLARTPPDPLLLRLCGMALVRSNAASRGLAYLARACRLAPQDPLPALWHGIALHASSRFAESAAAFRASAAAAPSDPAPLIHLSRSLMKLGQPGDAVAAAQRAVTLAPSLPDARHALCLAELVLLQNAPAADRPTLAEAWLRFGIACLRLDKILEARAALQEAVTAAPLHPEAAAWLALVEHLCGEPATSIGRLQAVLDRAPDCVIARLHLASRLVLDGDPAAALALLTADPAADHAVRVRWQAWRIAALTALGRHDEAGTELARVTAPVGAAEIILRWQHALLARAAGEHAAASALTGRVAQLAADRDAAEFEDRLDAHFRLATLRVAEGRHDQAFGHWRQGHALLRAAQPFSRATHVSIQETVMRAFDRDRLANGPRALPDASPAFPVPVFIVGLPRTGTTLTEQILSAHPLVHGAGERLAVRETLMRLTGTTDAVEAASRASALDAASLTAAAQDYLATLHAEAPEARIVLDKMPDNVTQLGFIATLLPGARVICCTRDLADVGASIFQQRFLGHHPYAHDLADLGWYMARHRRLLAHWREALTIPMLELDHADWIADFDTTLRRVLGFLGLPWHAGCVRFFEQQRVVRTASRDQVRLPVNTSGVGRWRLYETQLAPMLRELGA